MTHNDAEKNQSNFNRREFIRGTSLTGLMLVAGAGCTSLHAQDKPPAQDKPAEGTATDTHLSADLLVPVSCAVIGCGVWGREILKTLSVLINNNPRLPAPLPYAPVVAICDIYKPFLNRAKDIAPHAETYEDYKKLLEQKNVEAVFVATPSHLHKDIVLAALAAGKHVYCEAPLAHTIDDARTIAQAAKAAPDCAFQAGILARSDPKKQYIMREFIHPGALGKKLMARSQSHQNKSWRFPGNTPEREKEVNWRLDRKTSPGLMGEIGVHQVDLINWFLNERPVAVTGFGAVLNWTDDGRDVPDTVQAVFEYPDKVNYLYDATLANSFEGEQDMIFGSFGALLMRKMTGTVSEKNGDKPQGDKAWLFKEANADLFSWEIYASKEQFQSASGIVLSADATKSIKPTDKPSPNAAYEDSALNSACKAFVKNCDMMRNEAKEFFNNYGGTTKDPEFLADMVKKWNERPKDLRAAGWQEGFEATVCALKANEAILKGQKVVLTKDLFDI
jgi:predicted dehydrogenase